MRSQNVPTIKILIVEDNESDVHITRKTLLKHLLPHKFDVVYDGQEALDYLHQRGEFNPERAPRPDVILLDLNLPKVNGREILKEIRAYDDLKYIHVFIFSSSRDADDIASTVKEGAVSFIHKSLNDQELIQAVELFNNYWIDRHSS